MDISTILNLTIIILYGFVSILAFRLSIKTTDHLQQKIRYTTATMIGFTSLISAALLIEHTAHRNHQTLLLYDIYVKYHVADIVFSIGILTVLFQLVGAKDKMNHMIKVFYEVHQLREEVSLDPLTGLLNRRALYGVLDKHTWSKWCVIMIDLDDFKCVNDTCGHIEGDRLLQNVSLQIRRCIGAGDLPYRFGGEEMAVICPDATLDDGLHIAQRICEKIRKNTGITASIGVASGNHELDLLATISQADVALYEAKKQGKNRVVTIKMLNEPKTTAETA